MITKAQGNKDWAAAKAATGHHCTYVLYEYILYVRVHTIEDDNGGRAADYIVEYVICTYCTV